MELSMDNKTWGTTQSRSQEIKLVYWVSLFDTVRTNIVYRFPDKLIHHSARVKDTETNTSFRLCLCPVSPREFSHPEARDTGSCDVTWPPGSWVWPGDSHHRVTTWVLGLTRRLSSPAPGLHLTAPAPAQTQIVHAINRPLALFNFLWKLLNYKFSQRYNYINFLVKIKVHIINCENLNTSYKLLHLSGTEF